MTTKPKAVLISFHGDKNIKEKYMQRLIAHRKADEIIQGTGWNAEENKGCAVGCTLDNYSHHAYETELGIPRIIARLEDNIFEGLPIEEAKDFPVQFLEAVPVGVDLEPVWRKFMIWLLVDGEHGVIRHAKNDGTKKAIQDVASAYSDSLTTSVPRSRWEKLRSASAADATYAATAASYTATYAAAAASYTAADATDAAAAASYTATYAAVAAVAASYTADAATYAAYTAASAADAASDAATYAAVAASYTADAAAYTADAAASAADAAVAAVAAAARKNKYKAMRDQLLKLLREAA